MKNSASIDAESTQKWWESLGLPPPEKSSPLNSYRVVLLGFPLSGKRTLCEHLFRTASSKQSSASGGIPYSPLRSHRQQFNENFFQYGDRNAVNGVEGEASAGEGVVEVQTPGGVESAPRGLPSPSGVDYYFVAQNIPRSTSYMGFYGIPIVSRVLEFFCCHCSDALSVAIPSVESFSSSVVIMVIDVSRPLSIKEQLDWCFMSLEEHVRSLLRESFPDRDNICYQEMINATHKFWDDEEKYLDRLREDLQSQVLGSSHSQKNSEEVLRISGSSLVPALRTIIFCTKLDVLKELSEKCPGTPEEFPGKKQLLSFLQPVENSPLSVLSAVMQLMRYYAMFHQSALASIQRNANGYSDADLSGHPFYKGLLDYLEHLLKTYSSSDERSTASARHADVASLVEKLKPLCNIVYLPYFLIPSGVDKISLLSGFISAEKITFPTDAKDIEASPQPWLSSLVLHQDLLRKLLAEPSPFVSKIPEKKTEDII